MSGIIQSVENFGNFIDREGLFKMELRGFAGDKPHSCDLCHKKFALACNLRAHVKTHEGDSQGDCSSCGKPFLIESSKDGVCSRCKNDKTGRMNSAAEESSDNHTEDSTTAE